MAETNLSSHLFRSSNETVEKKEKIFFMCYHIISKIGKATSLCFCYLILCLEINIFEVPTSHSFGSGVVFRGLLVLHRVYLSSPETFG